MYFELFQLFFYLYFTENLKLKPNGEQRHRQMLCRKKSSMLNSGEGFLSKLIQFSGPDLASGLPGKDHSTEYPQTWFKNTKM